jgi:hypothetical protein
LRGVVCGHTVEIRPYVVCPRPCDTVLTTCVGLGGVGRCSAGLLCVGIFCYVIMTLCSMKRAFLLHFTLYTYALHVRLYTYALHVKLYTCVVIFPYHVPSLLLPGDANLGLFLPCSTMVNQDGPSSLKFCVNSLLGKPLFMDPLSTAHYISVLHG